MTRARDSRRVACGFAFLLAALGPACKSSTPDAADAGPITLSREELLKPERCQGCHPIHYREWASSMHAYAGVDPVFIAMNKRGQRETNGELGDFCVRCHAPMALIENKTTDGLNIEELPRELKGVTCYFCHNAVDIEADHNGSLTLANDTVMRGSFADAVDPGVHGVAYSPHFDRKRLESSKMCGACHDVVTPKGVHMERTFKEYSESLFPKPGASFQTCVTCHMDGGRTGKAAVMSGFTLPDRTIHEHMWPGVDVALTDFPDREAQRLAVECALANSATVFSLLASPAGEFTLELETEAGHAQPSGAAQDRRLWVELVAYDENDEIVYQSGAIADDELEEPPAGSPVDPRVDPHPKLFRDRLYDAAGNEVHLFWEAEQSMAHPEGYTSNLLQPISALNVRHTVQRVFSIPSGLPERVTVRLRMRPMGRDVLEDLVASGDLDPALLAEMPTFTLHGTVVEWKRSDGFAPVNTPKRPPIRCPDDYRCLLDDSACP